MKRHISVSRIRVGFQVLLHVALVAHVVAYYVLDQTAVGGLDFQDFFHSLLGDGVITYAVIFALAAYLIALVVGRFFCSWGCHFGATQDFAAWILAKLGWRGPIVKTRFLNLAPFALLAAIFLWPAVETWFERGWSLAPISAQTIAGAPPWERLPGWAMSILTFVVCGAALLLFLGRRGFCRFVCPYGALFRLTERITPFRVRRTGDCAAPACGSPGTVPPCTRACPTAIDVHAETEEHGAVRSIDCVRCHLCIEACPSGALAYRSSFRPLPVLPSTDSSRSSARAPATAYTWTLRGETVVAAIAVLTYAAVDLVWGGHFVAASAALGQAWLAGLVLAQKTDAFARPPRRWRLALGLLLAVGVLATAEAGTFQVLRWHGFALRSAAETAAASNVRELRERSAAALRLALELFPGQDSCREALIESLVELGDPRAIEAADELRRRHPDSRPVLETLRRVLLRFGDLERAELVAARLRELAAER